MSAEGAAQQVASRSPSIAAFLSFIWPGLGHWYTRRDRAAILFAVPYLGVVLVIAAQASGGIPDIAALLISPSSALTVCILIVLLGFWREIAVVDSAMAIRPRGAWRRWSSLLVLGLVSLAILATHLWAGSVAWAFYEAGSRVFVGAEGPDAIAVVPTTTSSAPDGSAAPTDMYAVPPFATPATSSSRINVLLTGVDSEEQRSKALTDTLIVASIDPVTHHLALISFPSDIADFALVDGGTYRGKINTFMTDVANHPGKYRNSPLAELARELGFLVGAPIHYYGAVDLAGFRTLIDAAGGVTITNHEAVDDPTYAWLDGRRGFKLPAGTHALDGDDALAYVRARSAPEGNDLNRARRQQEVLVALLRKLTTPSMLPRIQQLVGLAGDTLRTNFPSNRISEMLALVDGVDASSARLVVLGPPYAVPSRQSGTAGSYTLHLDLEKVAALSTDLFGADSTYVRD